jgi:hypothetical protein
MERDRSIDVTRQRLRTIERALADILVVADECEEHLLGAKIAESHNLAGDRIASLDREAG